MDDERYYNLTIPELVYLIKRFKQKELTPKEYQLLEGWLNSDPRNREVLERTLVEDSEEAIEFMLGVDVDSKYEEFRRSVSSPQAYKKYWKRLSIAACFLLATTLLSVYFLGEREATKEAEVALDQNKDYFFKDDEVLFVDGQKGHVFKVDPEDAGVYINELSQTAAQMDSDQSGNALSQEQVSKVITPKGKKVQFYLDDGTLIHLNASSELSFYTNLENQDKREVWLNGEAYFEVTHNQSPFIVHTEKESVEVFGTTFNVDGFKNSSYTQVSLIEGSVAVSLNVLGVSEVLSPGKQLTYSGQSASYTLVDVAPEKMAMWLDDLISFHEEDIQSIATKLSRWYDVDFVFDDNPPLSLFTATLSLKEGLPSLLEKLGYTKKVRFEQLANNQIAVKKI